MLKKFIAVRNIGRFINSAHADVSECGKAVLVLGGNAFGKTTLCAIFRSLGINDPGIIIGRTRVGDTAEPSVELRFASGNVTFRKGTWSDQIPDIAVFDGTFISENVHAGDVVDIDQRRNLYRVIIGKEGVGLALEEERLASESRAKASDISNVGKAIQTHIPPGMRLGEFIQLPLDPDIEEKIAAQGKLIEAVRSAEQLKRRAGFAPLRLPTLPADFDDLISKTLDGIAKDAQEKIAAHIAHYGLSENWLQEGAGHIVDESCPYCGQSVTGLALIEAYRKVFAESYRDMKQAVEDARVAIERDFGDRAAGGLDTLIEANLGAAEFWARYCELPDMVAPKDAITAMTDLGVATLAVLRMKASAPQDAVAPGAPFAELRRQYDAAQAIVSDYNAAAAAANAAIADKKAAVSSGDLRKEEATLARLNAQKKRHDPRVAPLCADYTQWTNEKNALDNQKAGVRTKLEQHTTKVMRPYEQRINQLLENFNAPFRIAQTKPAYTGGVASSTYQLVINNTGVNLGDGKTPVDQPSFRNTLSAGDKSTLALAVFIADLERDPDRASRIVVFDDPFTSQDSFRRRQTIHEIKRIGESCRQLIVFSHDATFLRQIAEKFQPAERTALQLVDHRSLGIKIMSCDLDAKCRGRAASDMDDLQAFITTGAGEVLDVSRKMRVVLETHCRSTYSGFFDADDALGEIVGKIRKTGDEHPAWELMDELDQINDYSRDHHHGEDPEDGGTDFIDPQELTGYVRRTLRIVNNLQA